ncbi:MAG: helix-turn-helix domain-containing protein [Solirubrobacteraceae bacterium]
MRELRSEQGLTLAQVAARASVDVSTLSRLGVTADDLLGAPAPQDPRVRSRPQRHAGLPSGR